MIQTTEEQSQTILRQLPGIFQLIMAEDHDELLRTVALQAAVFLGEAASLMPATREESNAFLDGDAVSPFYPSVQDVVEVSWLSH